MSDYPFFFTWAAQHQAKPFELTGGQGAPKRWEPGITSVPPFSGAVTSVR